MLNETLLYQDINETSRNIKTLQSTVIICHKTLIIWSRIPMFTMQKVLNIIWQFNQKYVISPEFQNLYVTGSFLYAKEKVFLKLHYICCTFSNFNLLFCLYLGENFHNFDNFQQY